MRRLVLLAAIALGCRRGAEPGHDSPNRTAPSPSADEADATSAPDALERDAPDPLAEAIAELADASFDAPLGGRVTIASVRTTTKPPLPDAAEAVAAARWRFRACARAAPPGGARVTVAIRIGEGGEPIDADVSPATTPEAVSTCVRDAARRITFAEPETGSATVEVVLVLGA